MSAAPRLLAFTPCAPPYPFTRPRSCLARTNVLLSAQDWSACSTGENVHVRRQKKGVFAERTSRYSAIQQPPSSQEREDAKRQGEVQSRP